MPRNKSVDIQSLLDETFQKWKRGGPDELVIKQKNEYLNKEIFSVTYKLAEGEKKTNLWATVGDKTIQLGIPVPLKPVKVEKPWGHELWYTGMETRGESHIVTPQGDLPLSLYLTLSPKIPRNTPIILIKQLNPRSEPLIGDLYLEAHHTKHEVYFVTRVDRAAWPLGKAKIRLGVNQKIRSEYNSDRDFRQAYLESIQEYQLALSLEENTKESVQDKNRLRQKMNTFTNMVSISEGAIIDVPPLIPHSLQHGVQVLELQTPSYERMIISASQPLATQEAWDSEKAIDEINLSSATIYKQTRSEKGFIPVASPKGFGAWKIPIEPGDTHLFEADLAYGICVTMDGSSIIEGLPQKKNEACFVPSSSLPIHFRNTAKVPAICLVSGPLITDENTWSITS